MPPEDGLSFKENALIKARYAAKLPALWRSPMIPALRSVGSQERPVSVARATRGS